MSFSAKFAKINFLKIGHFWKTRRLTRLIMKTTMKTKGSRFTKSKPQNENLLKKLKQTLEEMRPVDALTCFMTEVMRPGEAPGGQGDFPGVAQSSPQGTQEGPGFRQKATSRHTAIEAMNSCPKKTGVSLRLRQILGIRFFDGDVEGAIEFMCRRAAFWSPIRDMFRAAARR